MCLVLLQLHIGCIAYQIVSRQRYRYQINRPGLLFRINFYGGPTACRADTDFSSGKFFMYKRSDRVIIRIVDGWFILQTADSDVNTKSFQTYQIWDIWCIPVRCRRIGIDRKWMGHCQICRGRTNCFDRGRHRAGGCKIPASGSINQQFTPGDILPDFDSAASSICMWQWKHNRMIPVNRSINFFVNGNFYQVRIRSSDFRSLVTVTVSVLIIIIIIDRNKCARSTFRIARVA